LAEGRKLMLGGVDVPFGKGLLGHSDADVLIHAVIDALLGAAALGDIGGHFPDTSDEYKDMDSLFLLNRVYCIMREKGYKPHNIDCTVICQAPKLAPYTGLMAENIRAALKMPPGSVNVKAKTEEGLGFSGSGEGIAAHSVCTVVTGD
jgi:2-C-methyl-D-erythritol 2,4-cyclodiphosphate synthase